MVSWSAIDMLMRIVWWIVVGCNIFGIICFVVCMIREIIPHKHKHRKGTPRKRSAYQRYHIPHNIKR